MSQAAAVFTDLLVRRPQRLWWALAMFVSLTLLALLGISLAYLFAVGVGIWGINIPVAWGFAITNFVWWIGIGHAGTFISAFLLLMRQGWRDSVNRYAETMTLLAVLCAGLFPLIHMGRPWLFFYLLPYPNHMGLWPQWRSPLVWDAFAVSTYGLVSLLFWTLGLIPDLAAVRDRTTGWRKRVYGLLALGWRGSARHWQLHQRAYLLLGALATPLVISVHSIVSIDFAFAIVPGWHATVFPPYFVAGAILSGFAMVATLGIPLRRLFHLEQYLTLRHFDLMAKFMLATSVLVAYGYASELMTAWYNGESLELRHLRDVLHSPIFYCLLLCNCLAPALFWWPAVRRRLRAVFVISLVINVGMWLERYFIVVDSLSHEPLPSSSGVFYPTFWDLATLAGTFGLFGTLFLIFLRTLPLAGIHELAREEQNP